MENENIERRPPCCQLICRPGYFEGTIKNILQVDPKIKLIDEHETKIAVHEEILKSIPDILRILQRVQYWVITITGSLFLEIILKKLGLL